MIAADIQLHKPMTVVALSPTLLLGEFQKLLSSLIFWTILALMRGSFASHTSRRFAVRTCTLVGDNELNWDKGRASRPVAICAIRSV